MKPSNTGRDWLKEWQECEDVPILSAMLVYKGDTDKGFIDLCEWAAQVAIAEYRKELAAKVGAVRRYDYVSYGGDYELELNPEGDYANVHDVLALLNENDDAE